MNKPIRIKKYLRWITISTLPILLGLILFIRFSPYKKANGSTKNAVTQEIIINASPKKVFEFMSAAELKPNWMLYIDHVEVLKANLSEGKETGTIRRYFANDDETGQHYDALVLKSEKNKMRVLKIFNYTDFPVNLSETINEQLFEALPDNKCALKLSLYYNKKSPDFWDELKAHLVSYRIKKVLKENLENLKETLESQTPFTKF